MKWLQQQRGLALLLAVGIAASIGMSACGKSVPAPPATSSAASVRSIELGSAINETDRRITLPTTTFSTQDRVYAAVTTAGPGLDGEEVRMDDDWLDASGRVVFHGSQKGIAGGSKPDLVSAPQHGGFAPGQYTLQIKLNGEPAASKEFTVR